MMKTLSPQSAFLIAFVACCAAPQTALSVKSLLKKSNDLNRQAVEVQGRISVDEHGLINVYSDDKDECIGLLLTQAELAQYSSWDNRVAVVTGTLESQGCGRDGFCDEHLCGPAVLSGVTLRSPTSSATAVAAAERTSTGTTATALPVAANSGSSQAQYNCLELVWENRPRSDRRFDLLNDRSGQDAISCSTLTSPSAFEHVLETMRLAARRKDKRTLVNLIAFPLTFVNEAGVVKTLNRDQALRSRDLIFTDEVLEAMQRFQLRQMMAVQNKGGAFLSGAIWLGPLPIGGDPKILTINLNALDEHSRRGLSERTYGDHGRSDKAVDPNPISAVRQPPRYRSGPQE